VHLRGNGSGTAYKPRSVRHCGQSSGKASPRLQCLCDHPSRPMRCRRAQAAYPELKGGKRPPTHAWASLLLGLAPDGGCLAADIAADAGGLLHHLFTLARLLGRSFSVALSASCLARVFPGIVLFGARTFLERHAPPAIARPSHSPSLSYLPPCSASIAPGPLMPLRCLPPAQDPALRRIGGALTIC
jgi:hypothetical protein